MMYMFIYGKQSIFTLQKHFSYVWKILEILQVLTNAFLAF